ncbi:hypothetical protein HDU93_005103, partial [Gonapodya sp. JEL0774]
RQSRCGYLPSHRQNLDRNGKGHAGGAAPELRIQTYRVELCIQLDCGLDDLQLHDLHLQCDVVRSQQSPLQL